MTAWKDRHLITNDEAYMTNLNELADNYAVAYSDFVMHGDNEECIARERALHEGIRLATNREHPIWTDGEPSNFEAAAEDAYEWLVYTQTNMTDISPEDQSRLDRCMETLRGFMGPVT